MTHPRLNRPLLPDWSRLAALAGLTVVGVYLCYQLILPFLPGVTWAVALAVIGYPLHRRVARVARNPNLSAGLTTTAVVLGVGIPVVLVAMQLAAETSRAAATVRNQYENGRWRETLARVPLLNEVVANLDPAEVEARLRQFVESLAARSVGFVENAVSGLLQVLVAVFVLFFCFRDTHRLLAGVRDLLPLSAADADRVLRRAEDAVHATVYGTLLAAALQATTGGLLFWALGIPAPVLWAVVMFVLGVLPFVGAFLVWVPVAIYLLTVDRVGAALVLVAWGVLMAGPVCNYLYAWAAGGRMGMHPVPALLAFIGGLAVFGVSGMVLGPCILTVTTALLDVWRHRLANEPSGASPPGDKGTSDSET